MYPCADDACSVDVDKEAVLNRFQTSTQTIKLMPEGVWGRPESPQKDLYDKNNSRPLKDREFLFMFISVRPLSRAVSRDPLRSGVRPRPLCLRTSVRRRPEQVRALRPVRDVHSVQV